MKCGQLRHTLARLLELVDIAAHMREQTLLVSLPRRGEQTISCRCRCSICRQVGYR